jgi:decaprenylphospho-beta-D-ribofuranose 2-oxidase
MRLEGWGRHPRAECRVLRPRDEAGLRRALAEGPAIARGNGRAYGDSALQPRCTLDMRGFDRMLDFDPASGRLTAEAGVILGDVIAAFLPRGWFPAITPGTKFVSLGGMLAADVHGKNHHRDGSMRACVDWVEVMGPDGRVTRLTPGSEGFDWTLGGMGLTGVILRSAIRLARVETGWIRQTTIPAADLDAVMEGFEASAGAHYSVAWIDCLSPAPALGRSLLMLGEHAMRDELAPAQRAAPFAVPRRRALRVPADAPAFLLSGPLIRAFNALYHARGSRASGTRLVDWDGYFYPLDALLGWNRIYGRRGFVQFQCALPLAASRAGLAAMLARIAATGQGAFLAVLKRFGPGAGRFSFPMEGYTLALDFPVNPHSLALMAELDRIAIDHGGRFYLAKDARLTAESLRAADDRAEVFAAMRRAAGLDRSFASVQSERLAL